MDKSAWQLPEATKIPCNECPWRKDSLPGHLGPYHDVVWLTIVHSDNAIACHKTISGGDGWESIGARQCAGAAQYRTNVFKEPRSSQVATAEERDETIVFGTDDEFLSHHRRGQ